MTKVCTPSPVFVFALATFALSISNINADDSDAVSGKSKTYVVDGSCSYENPWSGASCMEFRSDGPSSSSSPWTADAMQERCDTENDSKMKIGEEGCLFEEGLVMGGWCIKTSNVDAGEQMEATAMMYSEASNCEMSTIACENFLQGKFEAGSTCDDTNSDIIVKDVLVEDFANPQYIWESIMLDEDKMEMDESDPNIMGSNMFDENGNPKYAYNFSGYENEFNDTGYEERYNNQMMMMNSNDGEGNNNWRSQMYKDIVGSSKKIVDGIMVLTANITKRDDDDIDMMMSMGDGNRRSISMNARGRFPDLTKCEGLKFEATTVSTEPINLDEFNYRIEFGYEKLPDRVFGYGYRAELAVQQQTSLVSEIRTKSFEQSSSSALSFTEIMVPFKDFTIDWDWNTGEVNTSCEDDEKYCPDMNTLTNMETISISAVGNTNSIPVELHIKSIMGANCIFSADDIEDDKTNNVRMEDDRWTCTKDTTDAVDEIVIESMSNPSFNWLVQNDPVMGGASYSTVTMMEDTAFFSGEVKDIPFLGLPGFIQMESRGGRGTYPDVSCCDSLKLTLMSMEEYGGYRVSFGTKRSKRGFFAQGFKADFDLPSTEILGEYSDVVIPFDMFSVEWDEATGDQTVTCAEDPSVCPDLGTLRNMETIAIWGEGFGGEVNLHVKSISAVGCGGPFTAKVNTTTTVSSDSSDASDAEKVSSKLSFVMFILVLPLVAML